MHHFGVHCTKSSKEICVLIIILYKFLLIFSVVWPHCCIFFQNDFKHRFIKYSEQTMNFQKVYFGILLLIENGLIIQSLYVNLYTILIFLFFLQFHYMYIDTHFFFGNNLQNNNPFLIVLIIVLFLS